VERITELQSEQQKETHRQPGRPHPLVQRYARLPALVEPGITDIAASLKRLAELLASTGESATVNLHFVGVAGTQRWHLRLDPERTVAVEGEARNPTLEVITRPDVWREIAAGSLSPLLAFGSGLARVRGDIGLAKRLLRSLATSPDAVVEIC
jgi:hypothetical protein